MSDTLTLEDTLLAFSKQAASKDQVMRALCEHEGWFAPVAYACYALQTNTFDNVTLWGNEALVGPGKLFLFSSARAGHIASSHVQVGPYASPLLGASLFAALPAGLRELHVNPASPQEQGWYMADGALALGGLWGQAIRLEQMLAGKLAGNVIDALLDYPQWTILSQPNGAIVTAQGAGGLQNPGMVFTTPDCVDHALHQLGAQAAALRRVPIDGKSLFGSFPRWGVDGFLINPFGPGVPKVFDTNISRGIFESLQLRNQAELAEAEAKRLEDT